MIKKIDLFIIKKFLGTYVFAIALIISIVVVFDVNEKLDALLKAPLKATVFDYYLNFIPYFVSLFSPLFTFISVIFFTSKLADNSEIIAMLASGISFKRLLVPYMVSAGIIAGVNFYLNSYIIPPATSTRIEFQNNIQLQVEPGVIAYISRYDNRTKTGYRFSLEKFEGKILKSRLTAQSVTYDENYHWVVKNYVIRDFDGMNEYLSRGSQLDTLISIEPSDFLISKYVSELMTTPELKTSIDRQKQRGVANIIGFEIEYHRRFANTAAAFILTLIGMSLSSRKVKGGNGLQYRNGTIAQFLLYSIRHGLVDFRHIGSDITANSRLDSQYTIRFYRYRPLFQSPEISSYNI